MRVQPNRASKYTTKMNNGKPPEVILKQIGMSASEVKAALGKWKPLIYKE